MIKKDGRCTKIIARTAMKNAACYKKKNQFIRKTGLKFKGKSSECYISRKVLHGAENWTLQKGDQKHLERFEMWCWRRMQKINWTDCVKNKAVLHRMT
jgi:hypothetical protein